MPGKPIEKNECVIQYGQIEIFKHYKDKIKDLGDDSVYNVPMGVMTAVQGDFNKAWMRELMIGKGLVFRLPYRLGSLFCQKRKVKVKFDDEGNVVTRYLPVDWYKSKQKWAEMWPGLSPKELKEIPNKPVVFILNEHSDGYRYLIKWDGSRSNVTNHSVYSFVPNRANHRYLASVIKNPNRVIDYYEYKPRKRKKRKE